VQDIYILIFDADPDNYVWNNMLFILFLERSAFHEPKPPFVELKKKTTRLLTHYGRVTQICVFNTVKLGTSASSP